MNYAEIEEQQRRICEKYKTDFLATSIDSKVGIALETLGLKPLNGLRHLPEGNTNGWYIWGAKNFHRTQTFLIHYMRSTW